MGKTTVEAPQATREEQDLQRAQIELLQQQRDLIDQQFQQQQLLAPFLFREVGIQPVVDDQGNITGFEDIPGFREEQETILAEQLGLQREQLQLGRAQLEAFQGTQEQQTALLEEQLGLSREQAELARLEIERIQREEEQFGPLREEVTGALLERELAALRGELPVSPALLRDLEEQRVDLEARLRDQLGPGFETSTPGIEAISEFEAREAEILEGVRRGDITTFNAINASRDFAQTSRQPIGAGTPFLGGQPVNAAGRTLSALPGVSSFGFQQAIGNIGGAVSGTQAGISGFRADRQLELQAAIQEAQNRAGVLSSIFGGLGSVAGFAAGNLNFGPFGPGDT